MKNFAAIDFETANKQLSSVCSVGIVIVRAGQIEETLYRLIRPAPNYYHWFTTKIHGMRYADTAQAPVFPDIWDEIAPKIAGMPLIAHNSPFDEGCLKAVHRHYKMQYPDYQFYCTCRASRKMHPHLENHRLNTVAAYCGFDLKNHHHALADAEACARIAMQVFSEVNL